MTWLQQLTDFLGRFRLWFCVAPWESAVLVRLGRHVHRRGPGFHLKWPLLDDVYTQNTRLRIVNLPNQTLTTLDEKTVVVAGTVSYRITDVLGLYRALQNVEEAVHNRALGEIARVIASRPRSMLTLEKIAERVLERLREEQMGWGLAFDEVAIVDLVVTRAAYRLIGDQWRSNPQVDMDKKAL